MARSRATTRPKTEEMLMMDPPPAWRMCVSTARDSSHRLRALTLKVGSQSSSVEVSAVPGIQNAGIVEQHIHRAKSCHSFGQHILAVARVTDVSRNHKHAVADLTGDLFQMLLAAPDQRDPCAFLGEGEGAGASHSGTTTGNDGYFVAQAQRSVALVFCFQSNLAAKLAVNKEEVAQGQDHTKTPTR